jgi:hypothetical protein
MRLTRLFALIVLSLALEACGGSYVYRRTLGPADHASGPAHCRVLVFEDPPVAMEPNLEPSRNGRSTGLLFRTAWGWFVYREIGVIEFRGWRGGDWPTRDVDRFRDWIAPTICNQGGQAIAARIDERGRYVGGTVLALPVGAREPGEPEAVSPMPLD